MAATTYLQAFRLYGRTQPSASAGTMTAVSSAATSLNASGSTGVGRPAKTYATHVAIQTRVRPEATNKRAAHEPHGRLRPEALGYRGDFDPR